MSGFKCHTLNRANLIENIHIYNYEGGIYNESIFVTYT